MDLASRPSISISFHPDGNRHTETGYSVEDGACDFGFRVLIERRLSVEALAGDGLVAIRRSLHEALPVIPGATLPSNTTVDFDRSKRVIALRRRRLTQNGGRPRRDDHPRRGMLLRDIIISCVAVRGSIGCHQPIGPSI